MTYDVCDEISKASDQLKALALEGNVSELSETLSRLASRLLELGTAVRAVAPLIEASCPKPGRLVAVAPRDNAPVRTMGPLEAGLGTEYMLRQRR